MAGESWGVLEVPQQGRGLRDVARATLKAVLVVERNLLIARCKLTTGGCASTCYY